jgi:hypothetical protein
MSDFGYLLFAFVVAVVTLIAMSIWDALKPDPMPRDGYPHNFFFFP